MVLPTFLARVSFLGCEVRCGLRVLFWLRVRLLVFWLLDQRLFRRLLLDPVTYMYAIICKMSAMNAMQDRAQ